MKHVWTIVCERSIIDSQSNNISLINALEQIQLMAGEEVQNLATTPGESPIRGIGVTFEVVTLWCRNDPNQPESAPSQALLLSPTGDEMVKNKMQIDLTNHQRMRVKWGFGGIPYSGDGRYLFVVQQEIADQWQTVAEIPLDINRVSI